jgi:hypothetical protein
MRLRFTLLLALCCLYLAGSAQKLSGQWTGGFISSGDPWGGGTEYVLELEVKGTQVQGFSYTYFIIMGKRYYVICRLSGSYDKDSKSMVVTEVEKVKANTPPDFRDCLQTHMLTYLKKGEEETLEGRWKPARPQDRCGTGETNLHRRMLAKMTPTKPTESISQKNSATKTAPGTASKAQGTSKQPSGTTAKAPATGKTPSAGTTKPPATAKTNPPATRSAPPTVLAKPQVGGTREKSSNVPAKPPAPKSMEKPVQVEKTAKNAGEAAGPGVINPSGISKLERRTKQVIRSIEVPEAEFTVHLYDNGQVDGDTVSLYFNGKLVVASRRLSTTPISLPIKLDPTRTENELVMYAENLGSIPPNTALMVVTVGDKRYEVNITSTEQTSGTVRFRLKESP